MIIKHIHTYKRHPLDKTKYICTDKYCSFITDRLMLIGKAGMCPKCHEEFILSFKNTHRRALPICINCAETKEAKELRSKRNLVADLFPEPVEPTEIQERFEK